MQHKDEDYALKTTCLCIKDNLSKPYPGSCLYICPDFPINQIASDSGW